MPQPEADGERRVDLGHAGVIQPPHALLQPPFINGSYLLQQNDRVPHKAAVAAGHVDVRGQAGFIVLAGDGRRYDGGTVPVAHIVLHNEHRPNPALLAAHYGAQIGVVDIAALDGQMIHPRTFGFVRSFGALRADYSLSARCILCGGG